MVFYHVLKKSLYFFILVVAGFYCHASMEERESVIKKHLEESGIGVVAVALEAGVGVEKGNDGFFYDLNKAIFRELDLPVEYQVGTFKQTIISIIQGNAHLAFGVTNTELRTGIKDPTYYFSELPVMDEEVWVLCRLELPCEKDKIIFNQSFRFAEFSGYGYPALLNFPVSFIQIVNLGQAASLMRRNRLDYVFHAESGEGVEDSKTLASYNATLYTTIETHAVFPKNEEGRLVKEYFDMRVRKLLLSGELEAIYLEEEAAGPWRFPQPRKQLEWKKINTQ